MKSTLELKELREKNNKTLFRELEIALKKTSNLHFQAKFRKLKNYQEISRSRKRVARIWTILSERVQEEAIKGSTKGKNV